MSFKSTGWETVGASKKTSMTKSNSKVGLARSTSNSNLGMSGGGMKKAGSFGAFAVLQEGEKKKKKDKKEKKEKDSSKKSKDASKEKKVSFLHHKCTRPQKTEFLTCFTTCTGEGEEERGR